MYLVQPQTLRDPHTGLAIFGFISETTAQSDNVQFFFFVQYRVCGRLSITISISPSPPLLCASRTNGRTNERTAASARIAMSVSYSRVHEGGSSHAYAFSPPLPKVVVAALLAVDLYDIVLICRLHHPP